MTSDKTFQEFCGSLSVLRKDYERCVAPVLQQFLVSPVWEQLRQVLVHVQSAFSGIDWPRLQQGLSELPLRTQKLLLHLGKQGWFFDMEMGLSDIQHLEELAITDNVASIDAVLIEHFKSRTFEINQLLTSKHPLRAKILCSAFSAHSRGEYALSVPVFLAQAEGICVDTINHSCFVKSKQKKKDGIAEPSTAVFVNGFKQDTFLAALLRPLAEPLPVSASTNERPGEGVPFNRHTILHGESVDYDTEINSLKAISFLNYIDGVLAEAKERKEEAP